jgi:hypothetical protein
LTEFHNDTDYTFWNGGLAAVFAAAEIAQRGDIIGINVENVYKAILTEIRHIHKQRRIARVDYEGMISEFANQNINSMLAINGDKVSVEPKSGKLFVRCEVDTNTVFVSKDALNHYLREKQINISHFHSTLVKEGVLLERFNSKGELQDKKRMATGWKDAVGAFNIRAYEFKLDVSDVIDPHGPGQDNSV